MPLWAMRKEPKVAALLGLLKGLKHQDLEWGLLLGHDHQVLVLVWGDLDPLDQGLECKEPLQCKEECSIKEC